MGPKASVANPRLTENRITTVFLMCVTRSLLKKPIYHLLPGLVPKP